MTRRGRSCEVTSNCPYTPYVVVAVTVRSQADMAPFGPVTATCRRHVSVIIEHAVKFKGYVRVRGIE